MLLVVYFTYFFLLWHQIGLCIVRLLLTNILPSVFVSQREHKIVFKPGFMEKVC